MKKVILTKEVYDYLVNKLLKKHEKILSRLKFQKKNSRLVVVELDDEAISDIRKLAGNEVRHLYFSKNRKDSILEHLIDILWKIKIKVNLTKKEYDYLINNLLNGHTEIFSKLAFFEDSDDSISVELEAAVSDDIRELTEDKIGMDCFDENYEPTEEGWILEHFIDKFYVG
jgi:hypothetical protein